MHTGDLSIPQNWFDLQTLLLCYHMHRTTARNPKQLGEAIKACAWKLRNSTKDPDFYNLLDSLARAHWVKAKQCIEKANKELQPEFSKTLEGL